LSGGYEEIRPYGVFWGRKTLRYFFTASRAFPSQNPYTKYMP